MKTAFLLAAAGLLALKAGAAEFTVYPTEGALNPRVPVIATAPGGAKGKMAPFEMVNFTYRLSPHLENAVAGTLEFHLNDSMRRSAKEVIRLGDGADALRIISPAAPSESRRLRLQCSGNSATSTTAILPGQWQQINLAWESGKAKLRIGDAEEISIAIPAGFSVGQLTCQASLVDEIKLSADGGSFRIDWENDYSGCLIPAGSGGVTANVLGFDTFVIGSDPQKRDYPVLQLSNSTNSSRRVAVSYALTSEVAGQKTGWRDEFELKSGSQEMRPIVFPQPLINDVCHLQISIDGMDKPFAVKKNFLYVERRPEKPGLGLFGLHDCNLNSFGFWPDALPLRYAHKYLRWGWTQGPAFENKSNEPERDPEAPPAEWNWNAALDWELLSGREMFVSLQSYPYSSWHREREYSDGMKIWPNGVKGGGFPKLDVYGKFVSEAAKRYQGKIRHYEIENEPNAYGMPKNPEDYALVCRTVYESVKKIDPQASVYGICGTGAFIDWMKRALAAGAGQYFDILSYHTYTTPRQPDQVNLRQFLGEIQQAGPAGKRRFNSETGVLQAFRYQADQAIPAAEVAAKSEARQTGFVSSTPWPGRVNDEWEASASMVKNAVINLAGGSEGFIFFGWNPNWPIFDKPWTEKGADFSLLSITPEGERTPTLLCLAVGVLTAQFESVDLAKPFRFLDAGDLRGAAFSKVGGGQVAVLWSGNAASDVLLTASGESLETVNAFGQTQIHRARQTMPDGRGVFLLSLTTMPVYVHAPLDGLTVLSSPVSGVSVENITGGTGKIAFALLNTFGSDWNARIKVGEVAGLTTEQSSAEVTVRDKRRRKVEFTFTKQTSHSGHEFQVPFTIQLPSGLELTQTVKLMEVPTLEITTVPASFAMTGPDSLSAHREYRLDKTEQAVFGRPSDLASIQEAHFWGGPDELSGSFRLASNEHALFVALKVRDKLARLPSVWPGVLGSCVELFFDFRDVSGGLGTPQYTGQVYQFLLLPTVAGNTTPKLWCPQMPELKPETIMLSGAPIDSGYWLTVTIPWKTFRADGKMPSRFGFDAGINGSFGDRDQRKTQLMYFGTGSNFRDASGFGVILVKPEESAK